MGKRRRHARQKTMWVASTDLPQSAGHPFYERLNRVLDDASFDAFVEAQCARFYTDGVGRPSVAPGRYFRRLLLGYFEGLDSERAIAWRAADSLSIRQFLDFELHEPPPDHSTVSRTRRLIDLETHQAVFTWVLQRLADAQLVKGRILGIDATTLEANAALRSIVRRDTGEEYEAWLTRLAVASGIATPTRAELARFDRKRKKKGANDDWTNPHDPDAKITKMKDGRTHLAHTAEHAVDLETGAVVGVTVQDADAGDTTTMVETLITAAEQVEAVLPAAAGITEVVGDKGYHSNDTMVAFADLGVRSYVSEPDRGRRNWKGKAAAREAVYANRRRIRGTRGQRLLRQRGERLERPNAHLYETGRMRRVHLRGHPNILKHVLVHICGFNLGLLMRQLTGVGTPPRSLQGRAAAAVDALMASLSHLWTLVSPSWARDALDQPDSSRVDLVTGWHEHHAHRFTSPFFYHGLLGDTSGRPRRHRVRRHGPRHTCHRDSPGPGGTLAPLRAAPTQSPAHRPPARLALNVHAGQACLRRRVPQFRCESVPAHRFRIVLLDATAVKVHSAETELRNGVALLGRQPMPSSRCLIVLCDTAAIGVHRRETRLGRSVSLLRGELIPQSGLGVVLVDPLPPEVQVAKTELREWIALITRKFKPPDSLRGVALDPSPLRISDPE